jgi:hypothetical protein
MEAENAHRRDYGERFLFCETPIFNIVHLKPLWGFSVLKHVLSKELSKKCPSVFWILRGHFFIYDTI